MFNRLPIHKIPDSAFCPTLASSENHTSTSLPAAETGKEQVVQVHYDESLASYIAPEGTIRNLVYG